MGYRDVSTTTIERSAPWLASTKKRLPARSAIPASEPVSSARRAHAQGHPATDEQRHDHGERHAGDARHLDEEEQPPGPATGSLGGIDAQEEPREAQRGEDDEEAFTGPRAVERGQHRGAQAAVGQGDERHGRQRHEHAHQVQRAQVVATPDPHDGRDGRREQGRERRDEAHRAARQGQVEEGQAEDATGTRGQRPGHGLARRQGLPGRQEQDASQHEAHALRQQDGEDVAGETRGDAPGEVGRAPRRRREEGQERREELVQSARSPCDRPPSRKGSTTPLTGSGRAAVASGAAVPARSRGVLPGGSPVPRLRGRIGRQRGGCLEDDELVGERVEAVRAGQQDDLEALLGGHVAEHLQGTLGTLGIEGHERVVEDDGRPAVHRHEAHEPESGRQVELVGRALRETRRRPGRRPSPGLAPGSRGSAHRPGPPGSGHR